MHISRDEQKYLDGELGLKDKMPDGWTIENGGIYARLDMAGIKWKRNAE